MHGARSRRNASRGSTFLSLSFSMHTFAVQRRMKSKSKMPVVAVCGVESQWNRSELNRTLYSIETKMLQLLRRFPFILNTIAYFMARHTDEMHKRYVSKSNERQRATSNRRFISNSITYEYYFSLARSFVRSCVCRLSGCAFRNLLIEIDAVKMEIE